MSEKETNKKEKFSETGNPMLDMFNLMEKFNLLVATRLDNQRVYNIIQVLINSTVIGCLVYLLWKTW